MKIKMNTYLTKRKISYVRSLLKECPNLEIREEGLACLRNAKPNYLSNLIPSNHPDRIAAVRWILENSYE